MNSEAPFLYISRDTYFKMSNGALDWNYSGLGRLFLSKCDRESFLIPVTSKGGIEK